MKDLPANIALPLIGGNMLHNAKKLLAAVHNIGNAFLKPSSAVLVLGANVLGLGALISNVRAIQKDLRDAQSENARLKLALAASRASEASMARLVDGMAGELMTSWQRTEESDYEATLLHHSLMNSHGIAQNLAVKQGTEISRLRRIGMERETDLHHRISAGITMQATIDWQDQMIDRQKKTIERQSESLVTQDETVRILEASLQDLRSSRSAHESAIATHETRIAAQHQRILGLQDERDSLARTISDLNEDLFQMTKTKDVLQQELSRIEASQRLTEYRQLEREAKASPSTPSRTLSPRTETTLTRRGSPQTLSPSFSTGRNFDCPKCGSPANRCHMIDCEDFGIAISEKKYLAGDRWD